MPSGFKVADIYADFDIDVDGPINKAVAKLKASAKKFDITVKVDADTTAARKQLTELGKKQRVTVQADLDSGKARADLLALGKNQKVTVNASVDGKKFAASVAAVTKVTTPKIAIDADPKMARAKIDQFLAEHRSASIAVDAKIDKAVADLRRLTNQYFAKPQDLKVRADIDAADAKLKAFLAKKYTTKLGFDTDYTQLESSFAKVVDRARDTGSKAGKGLGDGLGDGARKGADETETAMSKVASRTQAQFQAIQFAVAFAGLPVAAAAAGLGAAAALGVVPVAMIALAATSQSTSQDVRQQWMLTANTVRDQAAGWTAPLADDLAESAVRIRGTIATVGPEIAAIATNSQPAFKLLTDTVDQFAQRAMPGLVIASANSIAPLVGVRDMTAEIGDGVTLFFTNLSKGAAGSAGILRTTGGIIQDLLGFAGSFFANLANNGNPVLVQFRGALGQVEGTLLTLTEAGSGAYDMISGFLDAASGGLGVIQLLATGLNALPEGVTQFGGALFATQKMLGVFGISAQGAMLTAKNAFTDAERNGVGKFGASMSGLVAGVFNPFTLALAGGAAILDIYGSKMQARAVEHQTFQKKVQDLTQALRDDNGAIGANTNAAIQNALSQGKVYTSLGALGASYGDVNRAVRGNADAMALVTSGAEHTVAALAATGGTSADVQAKVASLTDQYISGSISAEEYGSKLTGLTAAQNGLSESQKLAILGAAGLGRTVADTAKQLQQAADAQRAMDEATSQVYRGMTAAQYGAEASANDLAAAWGELGTAGGDVESKGKAIIAIMDLLSGKQKSAEEASQAFNDTMRDMIDGLDKAAKHGSHFSTSMIEANGAINTVTEAGSSLQDSVEGAAENMASYGQALKDAGMPADQIVGKLNGMRDALAAQLKQLGLTPAQIDAVLTHYNALPADIVTQLKLEGDKTAQQEIQNVIAGLKQVPANVGVHVDAITTSAQKALLELGYTIIALPDGTFQVFADTAEGKAAADKLLADVNGSRAVSKVSIDAADAYGKLGTFLADVDGSTASPTMGVDPNPANWGLGNFLARVWSSVANPTMGVNPAPGYSGVGAFIHFVNAQYAAPTVGGNLGQAYGNVGGFLSWARGQAVIIPVGLSGIGSAISQISHLKSIASVAVNVGHADGGLVAGYAGGGRVRGPGGPRDDAITAPVLQGGNIKVSNGEFIVNAKDTQENLDLLTLINSGKFADGGLVQAAKEMLAQVQGGGEFFEDFSFKGNSDVVRDYNDQISSMYYPAGGEFNAGSGPDIVKFLQGLIAAGAAPGAATIASSSSSSSNHGASTPTAMANAVAGAVAQAIAGVFAGGVRATFDTNSLEKGLISLDRRRAVR